ncbi:hypothetical protein HNP38_000106 [Chryseobacterium defluvii]|uniref:Helix-turn-helix protein n=1 Tax=Chryseobacterium defluvii TaxID=160396 RepID=A0A840KAI4_9FLAO|nr:helix-turn-helix domain-containing protein [Chryseobacterium defluvii]MBB4804834.1 hypothetical protein [Chryseobacterium defluvii]
MEKSKSPDYRVIYTDIINKKYPHKKELCSSILEKKQLSNLDIINLNTKIFGLQAKENQKLRSYNKSTILYILDYQRKYKLNNSQLAKHFKLSRNTIAKWKKYFY